MCFRILEKYSVSVGLSVIWWLFFVAFLASMSALSFPGIPVWLGTHSKSGIWLCGRDWCILKIWSMSGCFWVLLGWMDTSADLESDMMMVFVRLRSLIVAYDA